MVVFVLRHADRLPDPADDLSPAGWERAELLARMLGESGITVAYHSGTIRAQHTLKPLKQRLGEALAVEAVGSGDVTATIAAVRSQPVDAVVAVVGHSNTVGPIVEGLGAGPVPPIAPDEFDRLFVLFGGPSATLALLRLRYGDAKPRPV